MYFWVGSVLGSLGFPVFLFFFLSFLHNEMTLLAPEKDKKPVLGVGALR